MTLRNGYLATRQILAHPKVKKVVNKKTIIYFSLIKLVLYAFTAGFFALKTINAQAAYGLPTTITQVKSASSSQVYYLDHQSGQKKYHLNEKAFLSYGNSFRSVKVISQAELDLWPEVKLIKAKKQNQVYYIDGDKKTWIRSLADFRNFNFREQDILIVNDLDLKTYREMSYEKIGLTTGTGGVEIAFETPTGSSSIGSFQVREVPMAAKDLTIGTLNTQIANFEIKETSGLDEIYIKEMVITNQGSLPLSELANFKLKDNFNNELGKLSKIDGQNLYFTNLNYTLRQRNTRTLRLFADIKGGEGLVADLAIKSMLAGSRNTGFAVSAHSSTSPQTYPVKRLTVAAQAENLKANNYATKRQTGTIIGNFRFKNDKQTLKLDSLELEVKKTASAPALAGHAYLVNYYSGQVLASTSMSERLFFELGGKKFSSQETLYLAILAEVGTNLDSEAWYWTDLVGLNYRYADDSTYWQSLPITGTIFYPQAVVASTNTTTNTSQTAATDQTTTASQKLLSWPTYSHRINYGFHDIKYPYRHIMEHNGIDIGVYQGSSVMAAAAGTVLNLADNHSTAYNYVAIRHDNGLISAYGHLSRVDVRIGQRVNAGQLIGLSGGQPGSIGSGPYSTGAHLHFEVMKAGDFVNPLLYLK
jgi:murein DD-endopeptidase MepM/ murein hydrolase activator NlpD